MTDFVPSPEMVEAGARVLAHAEGYEDWDALAMHAQFTYREKARAVLVAACTATVTEPCPTCEGFTGDLYDGDGHDLSQQFVVGQCPDHREPPPSWAWLVPFLNAGMLQQAGTEPVFNHDAGIFTDRSPLFRVLPPATPGEGQ